jgi:hypothetical protein
MYTLKAKRVKFRLMVSVLLSVLPFAGIAQAAPSCKALVPPPRAWRLSFDTAQDRQKHTERGNVANEEHRTTRRQQEYRASGD